MRRKHWICAVALAVSTIAAAQDDEPEPILSKDPLTKEQIAVYRAVLEHYPSDGDARLNLANRTAPLEVPEDAKHDFPCLKSLQLEPAPKPGPVVHLVDPAVALNPRMVLVDPEAQVKIVKENDPDNPILGKKPSGVTDQQLDHAVNKASETALFTFSEIVFDTRHRHALVIFSFFCGRLCGAIEVLLLKRSGTKWKISKSCGGGVS